MKILHIITRFNQGGTVSWLNSLSGLAETEILAVGNCSPGESEGAFDSKFKVTRIKYLQREPRILHDFLALTRLIRLVRQIRPTIVNTHTFKAGALGRLAVFLSGLRRDTKVIHTFHGHHHYGYFSNVMVWIINVVEHLLRRVTDCYIINGRQVELDLISEGMFKSKSHFVILPGVKIQKEIRSRVSDGAVKAGWLGRLTKIKRPERFLEIARRLPNIEFHVGGAGELEFELRKNAPSNVFFHGWVAPETFWNCMDIAILTSDNEAAPFSLAEAASFGLPCIASDVGSVSDIVVDKISGFLVQNDIEEFADKISQLVMDVELRARMGRYSWDRSKQIFSIDKFRSDHLSVYNKALE